LRSSAPGRTPRSLLVRSGDEISGDAGYRSPTESAPLVPPFRAEEGRRQRYHDVRAVRRAHLFWSSLVGCPGGPSSGTTSARAATVS
jgi:hypothetical protein